MRHGLLVDVAAVGETLDALDHAALGELLNVPAVSKTFQPVETCLKAGPDLFAVFQTVHSTLREVAPALGFGVGCALSAVVERGDGAAQAVQRTGRVETRQACGACALELQTLCADACTGAVHPGCSLSCHRHAVHVAATCEARVAGVNAHRRHARVLHPLRVTERGGRVLHELAGRLVLVGDGAHVAAALGEPLVGLVGGVAPLDALLGHPSLHFPEVFFLLRRLTVASATAEVQDHARTRHVGGQEVKQALTQRTQKQFHSSCSMIV